jgi:hypothetical protein
MPGHDEKASHFQAVRKEPENAGCFFGQALRMRTLSCKQRTRPAKPDALLFCERL